MRIFTAFLILLILCTPLASAMEPVEKPAPDGLAVGAVGSSVSAERELFCVSGTVEVSPNFLLHRALAPQLSDFGSVTQLATTTITVMQVDGEARLESSSDTPSYWRILGPVLLTAAVGGATWYLYSTRSR